MKCSVCGKEFGGGAKCQNCGVDRVTGLGNYSGYNNPSGSPGRDSSNIGGSNASNMMVCYACGEIIPANSTYCPNCGKQLFVTCPKCGHEYSSQYPNCNKCGTNREKYLKEQPERERKQREQEEARRREEEEQRKQQKKSDIDTIGAFLLGLGLAIYGVIKVMDADYVSIIWIIGGCGIMYMSIVD